MASIKTERTLVVIRNDLGHTSEIAKIEYDKYIPEELWIKRSAQDWEKVDDFSALGVVSPVNPEESGSFRIRIGLGEIFEAGIFASNAGPPDPQQLAGVKIFGIAKQPQKMNFVERHWEEPGGTFLREIIQTSQSTTVAIIGCKRTPFEFDADGLPKFDNAEGVTSQTHHPSTGNDLLVMPLLPGNDYECKAVVVDDFGNWDIMTSNFKTQHRKITVQFTTLHIYNDSDPGAHGEAVFNFGVYYGETPSSLKKIEEFFLPKMDIDDWSKTDRPYQLGFAHIGDFLAAKDDTERNIFVRSTGVEDDGPFDSDEGAWSTGGAITFPIGFDEDVPSRHFRLDAPPSTDGSDFHYGVDVVWSVEYDFLP